MWKKISVRQSISLSFSLSQCKRIHCSKVQAPFHHPQATKVRKTQIMKTSRDYSSTSLRSNLPWADLRSNIYNSELRSIQISYF
uniref:Uncharacterized protein n=1 Tax=Rhizophora mucronata TaxID=61149 RepID=A0A2P2P2J8_RHIMU